MAISFTPNAFAQGGVPLWTNRFDGPIHHQDYALAVATDKNGTVFVTGTSTVASGRFGFLTVAYSDAGVPLWTNRFDDPVRPGAEGRAIAVDGGGNVFVAGYSGSEYATVAYSGTGVPLWTNFYSGLGTPPNYANAIAVDASGNVFVTGHSTGTNGHFDYATVAYSSAGAPLWTNRYNGPGDADDFAIAIAADSSGQVFVTGYSAATNGWPENFDYATIKYSNTGTPIWTNRYNGPGDAFDLASAIAVDRNGNVCVTGWSIGTNGSGFPEDYATIKYLSTGVPLWTNRYNGPGNSTDMANAIAVDSHGNVFVTGESYSSDGWPYVDYATLAYASDGSPLWTNFYDGPLAMLDRAWAVAVDAIGNVFVTGGSTGDFGYGEYATVGYSNLGVPLWTNRYHGPGMTADDEAIAVLVDGKGNVIVTGSSFGSGNHYDYATIKYSSSIPPPVHLAIEPDGSGGYFIRFNGGPGFTYRLQRASDLTGPWPAFATNTAPASGLVEFHDPTPLPGGAFYRTVQP